MPNNKIDPATLDADLVREVDAAMNAATEALVAKLDAIDNDIAASERQVKALKATRRYLAQRLRVLGITVAASGPKKPEPRRPSQDKFPSDPKRVAEVRQAVEAYDGEFLASDIHRKMSENGGAPGVDAVRAVIRHMHEHGEIRAVRKVRGGATMYATIGKTDDAA